MQILVNVVRWILAAPLALVIWMAMGAILLKWESMFFNIPIVMPFTTGLFTGMAGVLGGVYAAPKRRPWVASVLGALGFLLGVLSIVGQLVGRREGSTSEGSRLYYEAGWGFISFLIMLFPHSCIGALPARWRSPEP